MKSDHLFILACAAILVLAILFSCSNQLAGGDVTETGNARVSGKILDKLGKGEKNVHVQLLPSYFDPVRGGIPLDLLSTNTDENGNYVINISIVGNYNIEAVNPISGDRALICNIDIKHNDTIYNKTAILQKTGTIKIVLPSDSVSDVVYAYIPGTTRSGTINGRIVIIDSVPVGSYSALCYVNKVDTAENCTFKKEFSVISGSTAIITDNQYWLFSRKLYFNTTSAGAAVNKNVYSFPVLIRLSTENFDFSQAKKAGEDIRLAKADGSQLSCEIERWEPSKSQAEIWVQIDTVYGNNDNQYIVMYWGNTLAQSVSSGAEVFDTADGFLGVWHLAGAGNITARDATHNQYDGTPSDTAPQATAGIIGSALQFDGKSNGLLMKNTANSSLNFPWPGTYTFSAWVSVDSVWNEDAFIAGKGFDQYALRIKGSESIPASMFALHEYVNAPIYGTVMRYEPLVMKQWKFMAGIRDTAGSYLFLDGVCVDSTGMVLTGGVNSADTTNFSIGRCGAAYRPGDYLPFRGKVDEVRIASVRFSADWIRLSYMNQKSDDRLIRFDK